MKNDQTKAKAEEQKSFEEIATELQLACDYWLRTIQPHIAGRKLRGAEYYVALSAYNRIKAAAHQAENWNRTPNGMKRPVAIPDVDGSQYQPPEPLYADEVKFETLASLAAQLLPKRKSLSPSEAVQQAHDLLATAERYVSSLPKRSATATGGIASLMFTTVTFAEIQKSNATSSGKLPLLPNLQRKSKGNAVSGAQSLAAIRKAVKDFLEQRKIDLTEDQYTADIEQERLLIRSGQAVRMTKGKPMKYQEWKSKQDAFLQDWLKENRVCVAVVCEMRWNRFKRFARKQQENAQSVRRERQ